jgi:hypothetical protein
MPRLLDLFCGKWGWSKAFAARGWECVGIDLTIPEEFPRGCEFVEGDVLSLTLRGLRVAIKPDFIVASSPCEEFSVFGMRCFFPYPKYPAKGIELFNYTRELCWNSGVPWLMENVRAAQDFVGKAEHHCGAFHLWGTGVPPLMPQGIVKGFKHGGIRKPDWPHDKRGGSAAAVIPPELANCVAEYAERLLEQKAGVLDGN